MEPMQVELACHLLLPDEPELIASCVVTMPVMPSQGMQIWLDNIWWAVTCVLVNLEEVEGTIGVAVVPEDGSGLDDRGRDIAERWFEENDWTVLREARSK
mgnify:CR=1 FL=1